MLFLFLELRPDRLELQVDHAFGHVEVVLVRQVVEELALQPGPRHRVVFFRDALADVRLELVQILHAHELRQLVVGGHRHRLADFLDVDLEHGVLAGQLVVAVLVREAHRHRDMVTAAGADQLVLETGNEGVGAKLQMVILGRAAGKFLTVDRPLEIDHQDIPRL